MAGEAEPRDVGHGMDARQIRELHPWRVELRSRSNQLPIAFGRKLFLFQRGGKNADAEGFAEDQCVARLCTAVALDLVRMHDAKRDQAIDGLERIDGMAACDRNV